MSRSFTEELAALRAEAQALQTARAARSDLMQEIQALSHYLDSCPGHRDGVVFTTRQGRPDVISAMRLRERLERYCRLYGPGLWAERRGHAVQFGLDIDQCVAHPSRPRPASYWRRDA
jgi:hypothetical protein